MGRRRILLVSHNYTLTGAPIVLMHLAVQLSRTFEVLVVSPFEGPLRTHLLQQGVNALVVVGLMNDINVSAGLLLSYDMLIANTLLTFLSIHAASHLRKPSAWYVHEGLAGQQFMQKFSPGMPAAMPLATYFVAPCQFVANFYAPVRKGTTALIPYGVDAPAELASTSASDSLRILQLGSIEPRKGQDLSCAAIRLLKNDRITLDIVGAVDDPPFGQWLNSTCADLPRVKLRGPADIGKIPQLLAECDVLIVPSRDEVTPMVILEAMAMGKPVIAAAVGGVPEMIHDGKTGFLVPPNDAAKLSECIQRVAADAQLRNSVGIQGREFVRSQRSLAVFGERFAQLVETVNPGLLA